MLGAMNRPCAKLLAIGKQLQPLRTARARTNSSSDILQPSLAIFALRILPDIELIRMRNRLRQKIDARYAQRVFSDVHAVGKNEFNSISPLKRRNSARLCQDLGAKRRGLMCNFQTAFCAVWDYNAPGRQLDAVAVCGRMLCEAVSRRTEQALPAANALKL